MFINNEPIWIDIDCVGEKTKAKYFGRFSIKKYLTHREVSEVDRLAATYTRGIAEPAAKALPYVLAQLAYHIVDTDAAWWKESDNGRDLIDEEPIIQLMVAIQNQQGAKKEQDKKEPQEEKS